MGCYHEAKRLRAWDKSCNTEDEVTTIDNASASIQYAKLALPLYNAT